jgi:hypothetical protein
MQMQRTTSAGADIIALHPIRPFGYSGETQRFGPSFVRAFR